MNQATTFAELAAETQRETLAALKQAQDLSLRSAELAVGSISDAKLPTPKETVEGAFGFAAQVLQQQKAYALRMTEILTGASEPAPVKTK
jgi:hypothetical protein